MNLNELTAEDSPFVPYHKGHTSRNAATLPFVAWDGEGITPDGQVRQNYVLFGNSLGYAITDHALSSIDCLSLIVQTARENPNSIHVGFSFSYDVEMILGDVPAKTMQVLYRKGYCKWAGYRIEYKRGKWFQVSKQVDADTRVSCRIWDVFSFFGTAFLKSVQEYLPDVDTASLQQGKEGRAAFTYEELDTFIKPYWKLELQLTVRLMDTLRERLYGAGLRIRQWHGPGAISTYALRSNKVASAMSPVPLEVSRASQFAYAGGRFELFQVGVERRPVYAYDIRSAYPSAIATLPSLNSGGEWRHVTSPRRIARFGVYRIAYTNRVVNTVRPHPLFYRSPRHAISYPNIVQGWYWSPEAQLALSIPDATILEGWEYDDNGSRPFAWVNDVYERRAQWKREGNPSQIALKLLLNSMYGKMAQRVGWERTGGAPVWHQLEWAGFVTSHARARLFRAMLEAHSKDSLLGVETDGIFTRSPLDLEIGEGLGQWECEEYESMIYLQSGFYHKRSGGKWSSKYRGFDKGSVSVEDTLRSLDKWKPWENTGVIAGTTTRFATMGSWLQSTDIDRHRNVWQTTPRLLVLGGDGKRRHDPDSCRACEQRLSPLDVPHDLVVSEPLGGNSVPHHLPWISTEQPNTYREHLEKDEHHGK